MGKIIDKMIESAKGQVVGEVIEKAGNALEQAISYKTSKRKSELASIHPDHHHLWAEREYPINEIGSSPDSLRFLDDDDNSRFFAIASSKGFELQNANYKRIAQLKEKRSILPKLSLFNSSAEYKVKIGHNELGLISVARTRKAVTLSLNENEITAQNDNNGWFYLTNSNEDVTAEINKRRTIVFIDYADASMEILVVLFCVLIAYGL